VTAFRATTAKTLTRVRAWCDTTTWGSARWHRLLAAAVAAFIFWPQSSVDATVGLNPSWQAGWALAQIHQLSWGPEIVFTFGPLGFLQNTAYYSFSQSLLASVYQPIILAMLFLGIAAALRERHAPMSSLVGAFVTTGVLVVLHTGHGLSIPGLEYPELSILAAFAWAAVPLLQQDPKRSMVFTMSCVLGAAAGFQLLVKLNSGMSILGIALAMSVLLDWKAVVRHSATVGVFALSAVVMWLIAGQRLGNLPVWLKYSSDIVLGYTDGNAMPLPAFAPLAVPAVVVGLSWFSVLIVLFFRGSSVASRRFVFYVALVTVILAKKNFVRLDVTSLYALMGLIIVGVAITPLIGLPRIPRRAFLVGLVAIVVIELGVESAVLRSIGGQNDDPVIATLQAPAQSVDRIATLALPGRIERRIDQAKARQRELYAIPASLLETIGTSTVHVDPNETSAAWAYNLAWSPAPVFQAYSAYTPSLDNLNAESLREATQFVLSRRSPASPATDIDGRLGVQESPLYSRALLCDYTVNGVENRWALFSRSQSHCGRLALLSQVEIRGVDEVTIPSPREPNNAILVGIDLQPTLLDRIFQGAVAPLTISTLMLDGVRYRLLAANAAEPFLVVSPPMVNGTNLQISARTIGIGRAPSLGQGDVSARLRFYEMHVGS
jgi:hypothetical protein